MRSRDVRASRAADGTAARNGAGTSRDEAGRLSYPRIASLKTAAAFRAHLERSGIALGFDEQLSPPAASPLAQRLDIGSVRVGNRFCILPMEGWDGTREGEPSELTRRRWRHFGRSGAKLIWGGEAVAVRHDGRANPNQLLITNATLPALAALRDDLIAAHRERFGAQADRDLYIGLQLTHSGRYARPNEYDRPRSTVTAPGLLCRRRRPRWRCSAGREPRRRRDAAASRRRRDLRHRRRSVLRATRAAPGDVPAARRLLAA